MKLYKLNLFDLPVLADHTLSLAGVTALFSYTYRWFQIFQSKCPLVKLRCCKPLHKTILGDGKTLMKIASLISTCLTFDRIDVDDKNCALEIKIYHTSTSGNGL